MQRPASGRHRGFLLFFFLSIESSEGFCDRMMSLLD